MFLCVFQQALIVRDPATGGACQLEAIRLVNDRSLVLQRNAKHLDLIGEVTSRANFQPKLDQRYQQVTSSLVLHSVSPLVCWLLPRLNGFCSCCSIVFFSACQFVHFTPGLPV